MITQIDNTAPESKLTVTHLRQLADYAEMEDPAQLRMGTFLSIPDEFRETGLEIEVEEAEPADFACGSQFCLIGMAAKMHLGDPNSFTSWYDYAQSIFPVLPMHPQQTHPDGAISRAITMSQNHPVFGTNLINDLPTRVRGLRMAADMIESGVFDTDALPS